MSKLENGTWIVVADAEKALFLRNLTDHQNPNFETIAREDQPTVDEPSDRPGRRSDSGPGQKSAMEEGQWRALARDQFAKDLARMLYSHAHKGDFSRMVLVAAPQVLGALRNELHPEVTRRIVAEVPKTLTNHPVRDLERLVKAELDAA